MLYSFTSGRSGDVILPMATNHRVPPILWTILCFLFIGFGLTPYSKRLVVVFAALRFVFVTVLSVLVVREWWIYQHRSRWNNMESDAGHSLLRKLRRWATDEPEMPQIASQIVEGGCCHPRPPLPAPKSRIGWMIAILVVIVVALALRH
jgi:hypothetical protein